MGSHSIRKSETISTRLMTPFWGAGELWPQGRRVAGGGARKGNQTGWGISLTAFIMTALHFFSVLPGNTIQITYCSRVLNALLWSCFSNTKAARILLLCFFFSSLYYSLSVCFLLHEMFLITVLLLTLPTNLTATQLCAPRN